MFEVHIMPDAALAASLHLMDPAPIVGVSFRLSMHTNLEDAVVQEAVYQSMFPEYVLSIVEV